MTSQELLLAIHEQCESTQGAISAHYNAPSIEVTKEVLYLLCLLGAYAIRHPDKIA